LIGNRAAIRTQSTTLFIIIDRSLKIKSRHNLDLPHRPHGCDSSKRRRVHCRIDPPELRHVQEVCRLTSNVYRPAVSKWECFVQ
jgi:hypothetical protein